MADLEAKTLESVSDDAVADDRDRLASVAAASLGRLGVSSLMDLARQC